MFQAVVRRPGSLSAGSEMARNPARVLASVVSYKAIKHSAIVLKEKYFLTLQYETENLY